MGREPALISLSQVVAPAAVLEEMTGWDLGQAIPPGRLCGKSGRVTPGRHCLISFIDSGSLSLLIKNKFVSIDPAAYRQMMRRLGRTRAP
jgi:hypothetical protein